MSVRVRAVVAIGFGLLLGSGSLQAAPDEPAAAERSVDEARVRFRKGVQLYREENLEGALLEFRRAYELSPSYRVLYNLGRVQLDLHDYVGALEAFRRYLAEGGDEILAERRTEVEGQVRKLDGIVARLEIVTNVDGVQIAIDDVRVGVSPLAVTLVNPGTRRVALSKSGLPSAERSVTLLSGERMKLAIDIAPAVPVVIPKVAPVALCAGACPTIGVEAAARPANPWAIWTGVAMTGVLAAGTGAFALLARDAKGDFDRELEQYTTKVRVDDARSRMKTYAGITDGLGVATLVSGAVTLVLALSGTPTADRPRARETIRVQPRLGGLSVAGDF